MRSLDSVNNMSIRLRNILLNAGVTDIEPLQYMSDADLFKMKRMGRHALNELRSILRGSVTIEELTAENLRLRQQLAMERGEEVPGLSDWVPSIQGRYYKILAIGKRGRKKDKPVAWLCVEHFVDIDFTTSKITRWMASYTDVRLNPRKENPEEICEWTLRGNDPVSLISDALAKFSAESVESLSSVSGITQLVQTCP